MPEALSLARLIQKGGEGSGRSIRTQNYALSIDAFRNGSSLAAHLEHLEGRSVVLAVRDMAKAAVALIDLDGWARKIVLCPPTWGLSQVELAARVAQADALVFDGDDGALKFPVEVVVPCRLPLQKLQMPRRALYETEWILPTSGTSGPPKFVVHTLHTLLGAIGDGRLQQWATFYDIRRYGGLQILLRALSGRGSLTLGEVGESVASLLARFGAVGTTHISGTPSHWRKVVMSGEASRINPEYVRLSGEIADDAVLSALRALYPLARIEHAYASTEAGVVFAVDDDRAGFPASWLAREGPVRMRIVDGALHVRSERCALRFVGASAPSLTDEDGFVDTGDMVERRGDRIYFVGRRGGVINVGGAKVHPEEVEAALNAHPAVRASRVFARKSPIIGAVVYAEVVLSEKCQADVTTEREILDACKVYLASHMVPVGLRFVSDLSVTDGGKIARHG